jgi:hypothetical protein
MVERFDRETDEQQSRLAAERALDQVLADSFPASDPPSWNPGIALLAPAGGADSSLPRLESIADASSPTRASGTIDVSRPSREGGTFARDLVSLAGAAGMSLLAPFAILLLGLPIALSVRGVIEVVGWLFGVNVQ